MYKFLLLIALVPAIVYGAQFSQCLNGAPVPEGVEVDVCSDDDEICKLVRGTDIHTRMIVIAQDDIIDPRGKVQATALGTTTQFPLPDDVADVCNNLDRGSCPIGVDEDFIYHFVMEVSHEYPITPLVLEISIVDEGVANSPVISCFRIQAETVDA